MKDFIDYLTQQIASGKDIIFALEKEGRRDDANFAKVRTNIYEVCKTVTGALINRPGAGKQAVKAQIEKFKVLWTDALEKAKENGDDRNIVVEETKLEALNDIIAHFPEE